MLPTIIWILFQNVDFQIVIQRFKFECVAFTSILPTEYDKSMVKPFPFNDVDVSSIFVGKRRIYYLPKVLVYSRTEECILSSSDISIN